MKDSVAGITDDLRGAYGLIAGRIGLVSALSLIYLVLYSLLWIGVLPLTEWEETQPVGGAFLAIALATAVPAAAPALFITVFLRGVIARRPARALFAWTPACLAVFWRLWVLNAVVSIGDFWLTVIGFDEEGRPLEPEFADVAIPILTAFLVSLVALRLTPVLAAAALGRPMGFRAAWRRLAGRFLRFAVVFAGLFIPLQIAAAIAWFLILAVATAVEEHLVFFVVPVELAFYGLATTLAVAATLAVFWPRLAPDVETPAPADDAG